MPSDTNTTSDVYLFNRLSGAFAVVNGSERGGNHSIDRTGEHVAFEVSSGHPRPLPDPVSHVFVWNRQTHTTEQVDVSKAGNSANATSGFASIDATGDRVAFYSEATNLVPPDTNCRP